jgi:hypothetical protein
MRRKELGMPQLNKMDLDDLLIQANETLNKWQAEADAEFHKPQAKVMIAMMWQGMDARTQDWFRRNMPEQARQMDQLFGGSSIKGQGG